jgi:hypothetical protein
MLIGNSSSNQEPHAGSQNQSRGARARAASERYDSVRARRELARWQARLASLDLSQWQYLPRDDNRSYLRLPSASGCETWLIRWPPGSSAPLHDHGDASAVALVLRGELRERAFYRGECLERLWQTQLVIELPKDVRHAVWNESSEDAYSVHVYAPQLTSMTFYEHTADGSLKAIRSEGAEQW